MYRVSVDVGGTFTDCLVLGEEGELRRFKSPTTPHDPSLGFLACLEKAANGAFSISYEWRARSALSTSPDLAMQR
jgi:N-methylhydantoinase A/oxoprolinase/acetone carboxylase beta subunit